MSYCLKASNNSGRNKAAHYLSSFSLPLGEKEERAAATLSLLLITENNMVEESEAAKAKKINWDKLDTPIRHEGRAITLPGDPDKMPIEKAIAALERKMAGINTEYFRS